MSDITKGFRADTLSINDQVAVTGGTADPRVTDQGSITIMPKGSLYISTTGEIYQKQGTSNLNWGKLVAEDFATGNVGIGTTAPTEKLHLDGNLSLRTNAFASNGYVEFGDSGTAFSRVGRFGNSGHLDIKGVSGNTNIQMTTSGTGIFTFTTSTLERMRIDSSGNVGIGTTSPQGIFHVLSSGTPLSMIAQTTGMFQHTAAGNNSRLAIISSTAGSSVLDMGDSNAQAIHNITCSNVSNNMKFTVFNAERMRIDSSGKVGIGTTSPTAKLHLDSISAGGLTLLAKANGTSFATALGNTVAQFQGTSDGFGCNISIVSATNATASLLLGDSLNENSASVSLNNSSGILDINSNGLTLSTGSTERMRVTNAGSVGIGTINPRALLHALRSGGVSTPSIDVVALFEKSATGENAGISLMSSTSGVSSIYMGDPTNDAIQKIVASNIDNSLSLYTNAAERMRIDSSGNVGIGTTVPATPSHVKQSSTTAAIPVETLEQLDTNEPFIEVLGTDNTTTGSVLSGKTAHGGTQKFIKCKINGVVGYLQWSTVPA